MAHVEEPTESEMAQAEMETSYDVFCLIFDEVKNGREEFSALVCEEFYEEKDISDTSPPRSTPNPCRRKGTGFYSSLSRLLFGVRINSINIEDKSRHQTITNGLVYNG